MSSASVQLINGLSFVSLVTSDEDLYHLTVDFYKQLGFCTIEEHTQGQPLSAIGIKTAVSHAHHSIQEAWLTAVPSPDFAADTTKCFGATLKVRLTPDGRSKEESKKLVEQFCESPHQADWRGNHNSFVLYISDAIQMRDLLKKLTNTPLRLYPTETAPVEICAVDPLGNLIGFTTRKNPYTGVDPQKIFAADAAGQSSGDIKHPQTAAKKRIAVMTSGGDAPGMNASVRAVVRTAIHRGCEAFAVYEGYSGLVQGGDFIREMTWDDVRGFLSIGGTRIGTARCKEFREREGRLSAAKNMVKRGIDALVVCGGDGSLTGADLFRQEWPGLIKELQEKKEISKEEAESNQHLYICGLVGSIDNDMSSTDATIGAYSSLARICEMVDYIDATAQSHSRAFVIEVMGRHCGWLALMAGIAVGADFVFLPEMPPKSSQWPDDMSNIVKRHREAGMRKTIVIVAEGAIDDNLQPITPTMVKDKLVDLGLDTRITTLGHVQRGGSPVAFDRLIATIQGVEAVDAILSLTPESPSPMIGLRENKIVRRDLMESVNLTKSVAEAIKIKDFDKAISLRDTEFGEHLHNFLSIVGADTEVAKNPAPKSLNIAIISVGAPAGGMNAAIRGAAAYCFSRGHKPYAIYNGWTGLARHDSVRELNWLKVQQWMIRGGCEIGTNRSLPDVDFGMIAYYFQKYAFDGLIIVGGFEAFHSLHLLEQARGSYPAFRIPMICLPATISNNVPGTEYSLGTDTCLNSLVEYCDVIKQSASSSRRRAFVVEVQGGNSGYIAAYAGLVTGAYAVYTPEEGISFKQLGADIEYLKKCFREDNGRNRAGRLLIRNENASKTFSTQTLADILQHEGGNFFEAREAIPGHVQQGGIPSPMDRVRATRLAIKCVQFLEDHQDDRAKPLREQEEIHSVIGIRSSKLVFTPIQTLWDFETEVGSRRPIKIFWNRMIQVGEMLLGRSRPE